MRWLTYLRELREESRLHRVASSFAGDKRIINRTLAKHVPSLAVQAESNVYSILIPAYRVEKYIAGCLASVLNQAVPEGIELEIIVAVDGCEKTCEAIREYLGGLPAATAHQVRVLRFARTFGAYVMQNSLVFASRGNIVQIVGGDDALAPGSLAQLIPFAITCAALRPDFLIRPMGLFCDEALKPISTIKAFSLKGAIAFSKAAVERLGGHAPWICAADQDFLRRAEASAIPLYSIPSVSYLYRQHDKQLSRGKNEGMKSDIRKHYWRETDKRIRHKQLKETPLVAEPVQ